MSGLQVALAPKCRAPGSPGGNLDSATLKKIPLDPRHRRRGREYALFLMLVSFAGCQNYLPSSEATSEMIKTAIRPGVSDFMELRRVRYWDGGCYTWSAVFRAESDVAILARESY